MADKNIVIQRNNAGVIDNVYPQTQWGNVLNKPTTFTPTAHTHGNISDTGVINTNTAPTSGQHLVITSSSDLIQQSSITIGTGTTTFLRNDGQWASPSGGGTVTGPASSTTGFFPRWNDTTGTVLNNGLGLADSTGASALSTGQVLVTERDVYYGTPSINNSKAYTSTTTIYAPTAGGSLGQVLTAVNSTSAPTWEDRFTNLYTNSTPLTISSGGTQTITLSASAETVNNGTTGNPGTRFRIIWGPTTATYIVSYVNVMPTSGSDAFTYVYAPLDVISGSDLYYMMYIRANATGTYSGTSWIVGGGKSMTMAGTQTNVTMYLRSIDRVNF